MLAAASWTGPREVIREVAQGPVQPVRPERPGVTAAREVDERVHAGAAQVVPDAHRLVHHAIAPARVKVDVRTGHGQLVGALRRRVESGEVPHEYRVVPDRCGRLAVVAAPALGDGVEMG